MYYLVAQSFPTHTIQILDSVEKKEDITSLVACYLKKTKGQLVKSTAEMLNVGVHIIKVDDKTYQIYKTCNIGWLTNNFYYEHVLTYRVVKYDEDSVQVAIPKVDCIEKVLMSGEADFEDKSVFFD